jgi:hypothetical protein
MILWGHLDCSAAPQGYFSFLCWARRLASSSRLVVLTRCSAVVTAELESAAGRAAG